MKSFVFEGISCPRSIISGFALGSSKGMEQSAIVVEKHNRTSLNWIMSMAGEAGTFERLGDRRRYGVKSSLPTSLPSTNCFAPTAIKAAPVMAGSVRIRRN